MAIQPHPQAAEILRQVEFYFGEDNLPGDAHLLHETGGDGNGPVSLKHICGFKKMRRYRPYTAVREALRASTQIDIVNNTHLKRRFPLVTKLRVLPKCDPVKQHEAEVLGANPHLTKGMLKPTGFEEYHADPPLRPEEQAKEDDLYATDRSFWERIETAVQKYRARRKMHQNTAQVFNALLNFGGFSTGPNQFTGSLSPEEMEGLDKKEIAAMKSPYIVSHDVVDSISDEDDRWVVDFEGVAKAFLSSHNTPFGDDDVTDEVRNTCNVMRNFYTYLLHHNVCAEYTEQIVAACDIVDNAEKELVALSEITGLLPGAFNTACSMIHGGCYSTLQASEGDWNTFGDSQTELSEEDARCIFLTGLAAFATEEQLTNLGNSSHLSVTGTQTLGLEVVSIEPASNDVQKMFEQDELKDSIVPAMGRLVCKQWDMPHAQPTDSPKIFPEGPKDFVFIVDQAVLDHCYQGLKLEATVKQLDLGIYWLDQVEVTYASFFTWLPNERIKQWKEPGPPKSWMTRQYAAEDGEEKLGSTEGVDMQ